MMTINDALKVLGIQGDYTPETIKKSYRRACAVYHPDRNPAGLEMMKLVNGAYTTLKDENGTVQQTDTDNIKSYGDEIFQALSEIIHLDLEIEICGAWVWLCGNTKPHKDLIKEAGFKWAPKKKLWYYRPSDYKSKGRGNFSMDDIRATHGSQKINRQERKKVRAA